MNENDIDQIAVNTIIIVFGRVRKFYQTNTARNSYASLNIRLNCTLPYV
jgi:hypothetical protein